MKDLSDFVEFKKFPRIPLHEIFSAAGDDLLDLLEKLFFYDPDRRVTATGVSWVRFYLMELVIRGVRNLNSKRRGKCILRRFTIVRI